MLTTAAYTVLTALLAGRATSLPFSIAVGEGRASWDRDPAQPGRSVRSLVAEIARRDVPSDGIVFLDGEGRPSERPTTVLRLTATFAEDEAVGVLRECGLITRIDDREVLLAYYGHPRLEKQADAILNRIIRLDFTPRPIAPGSRVTRWLGNTRTRELHDLEAETPRCQISEIAVDRRFYFGSVGMALEADYDTCAYCFRR